MSLCPYAYNPLHQRKVMPSLLWVFLLDLVVVLLGATMMLSRDYFVRPFIQG